MQANSDKQEEYFVPQFCHMAPELVEKDIVQDCTHKAGRPAKNPGMPQAILTCVLLSRQQQLIMAAVHDIPAITYEGTKIVIFQALSPLTLQRRRILRPDSAFLLEQEVRYHWGHPFRLVFSWNKETHTIHNL
ncbi:hypothetical protein NDU88_001678 [Pleurodeles waltl]|uniref:Uncharacterized protein n=1 Tax=Pleurodeles waltl TaxID=8319 RepID=A0AAV7M1U5_PLEWA|nr:hypothetical protein NDU88_001678 [Pleurodeles waltl]